MRIGRELLEENRRFYDSLWSGCRLTEPEKFNTWPLVRSLLTESGRRLEVAPGLRPRLPIHGTQFVDISAPALAQLSRRGADVILGEVTSLPFASATFELVCAFDIVEHVEDDESAFSELSRVTRAKGTVLLSTPLHPSQWTSFDKVTGHRRRYEPAQLLAKLARHHLVVISSAVFGMRPRSTRLVDLGMWWLTHHRERALWWYNSALMPLGLWFQKQLQLSPGMIATDEIDEILLVCKRDAYEPLLS